MKRINVTEPYLPPFEEYVEYLRGIWDRNWLTNQGPLVCELEQKLQAYHQLAVPVHCVANGSLGLQIALKALGVSGEVITTPFSYVATTACPLWEGCSVKFADIEPDTLTIDPAAVEAAITTKTEAILATHVFGNPCDVEALDAIAAKYGLAMIYDAAHAFGVTYKGKSLLEYGDVSMVSLHATKLFHAIEGGFVVARDPAVSEKVEWMRRFGHKGQEEFHGLGINAKLSEFHAAMGLCNFKHIEDVLEKRRDISDAYDRVLFSHQSSAESSELSSIVYRDGASRNYAYYPIIMQSEGELLDALIQLNSEGIFPRRYFYPSIGEVPIFAGAGLTPTSTSIARRIFCLPLSESLSVVEVDQIAEFIN
ncbi:MAG: DegT/DnrJ/EryC1/StrS family aminotransferase [Opitutaceae bacterium]